MFKERFSFVYGALAMVVLLSWCATAYMITHPYKLPKSVAHKSDVVKAVRDSSGDQNLAAQCEASITGTINQNAGQVTKPFELVGSKSAGDKQDVTVAVHSTLYNGKLTCSFKKSNWQLTGVKPSK